ncbi:MAG: phosphotransferase [Acidimicrobiaceae bacterium]|nr:phosphotransferase [Acidimicrobiaceae bacterium]
MAVDECEAGEGETLAGRVTEFVRVGNTVHRPATANSESMRQLLMHLEQSGFGEAPRVVGSGPDGGVVLTWIEGWVPTDSKAWKLDLDALGTVGELLRAYHGCAQGFTPDAGYEEGPQSVAEGQIVCHGDVAPRNTVFRDGRAVAFIDWDGIFVSEPIWDLAHAVWQFGPVCADGDPLVRDWPAPPNRSERIAALVGGYRLDASQARHLADRVVDVIAGIRRSVDRKAAAGNPAFVRMRDEGVLNDLDRQRQAAEQQHSLIVDAVRAST